MKHEICPSLPTLNTTKLLGITAGILIGFFFFFTHVPACAHAQERITVSLEPAKGDYEVGKDFTVGLKIDTSGTNIKILGYGVKLQVERDGMQISQVSGTNIFHKTVTDSIDKKNVLLSQGLTSPKVVSGNVTAANIVLRGKKAQKNKVLLRDIDIAAVTLTNEIPDISVVTKNGEYTIICVPNPECGIVRKVLQLCSIQCSTY